VWTYRALAISWQHTTLCSQCLLIPVRVPLLAYQGTYFWICLGAYYGTSVVSDSGHTNSGWKSGTSPLCDRCDCAQVQDEVHALLMCRDVGICALRRKYAHLFSQFAGDFSVKRPYHTQPVRAQAVLLIPSCRTTTVFSFLCLSLWIRC